MGFLSVLSLLFKLYSFIAFSSSFFFSGLKVSACLFDSILQLDNHQQPFWKTLALIALVTSRESFQTFHVHHPLLAKGKLLESLLTTKTIHYFSHITWRKKKRIPHKPTNFSQRFLQEDLHHVLFYCARLIPRLSTEPDSKESGAIRRLASGERSYKSSIVAWGLFYAPSLSVQITFSGEKERAAWAQVRSSAIKITAVTSRLLTICNLPAMVLLVLWALKKEKKWNHVSWMNRPESHAKFKSLSSSCEIPKYQSYNSLMTGEIWRTWRRTPCTMRGTS